MSCPVCGAAASAPGHEDVMDLGPLKVSTCPLVPHTLPYVLAAPGQWPFVAVSREEARRAIGLIVGCER